MQHDTSILLPKYLLKTNTLIQLINYWLCFPLNCLYFATDVPTLFNWLKEIKMLRQFQPVQQVSGQGYTYLNIYIYVCIYLYICICLNIAIKEKCKIRYSFPFFLLNHKSHQWEEQRERGQCMAESPTQSWLRDMFWGLRNLQLQGEEFTADYFDNIFKWTLKSSWMYSIWIFYLGFILTFFLKLIKHFFWGKLSEIPVSVMFENPCSSGSSQRSFLLRNLKTFFFFFMAQQILFVKWVMGHFSWDWK